MAYKVLYFRDAKQDVIEAKAWYKEQKPGLEKKFIQAVKDEIQLLKVKPFAYALRYKNIRIAHTRIFPFGVHFYIDELNDRIVVIGILHSKRDPAKASQRLKP